MFNPARSLPVSRAYNTTMPNSGKILSGGVEATALLRPKILWFSVILKELQLILGTALVELAVKWMKHI